MGQFSIETHINDFIDGKYAVNCKTEELANEFLNYCSKLGITWCTDRELINWNEWGKYKEETSFHKNKYGLEFGSSSFYKKESDYIVIEFTGLEDKFILVDKPKHPKPPLGAMPKNIFELQRVQELCRALYERSIFEEVDYNLMIKWSEELNDRLYGLKGDREFDLLGIL